MRTYSKQMVNEIGNSVTVHVSEKDISGVRGVLLSIIGPSSETDIHVTRLEAEAMRDQLILLLKDR